MKSGISASASESDARPAEGCVSMCGMCPRCVFAPRPPGSSQTLWRMSDEFRRRFLVDLLLRCRNTQLLESVHGVLGATTSGTLPTYARSRTPSGDVPRRRRRDPGAGDGKPLGLDMGAIWDWFDGSPDWMKSGYLCRLFALCDAELLRMVANLTSVLLVRRKHGVLQLNVCSSRVNQRDPDSDEDPEDPALMVVPGSSRSVSGVSRYRDFIGCLPVHLAKRILGLLGEHTLRHCLKVCQQWMHLAQQTMDDKKFRRIFQYQINAMMKRCSGVNKVSPTYANIVQVPVPVEGDETVDEHLSVQKLKPFEAAYAEIKTRPVQIEERNVYCGAYFTTELLSNEDRHRVLDYRGGAFMVTGSRGSAVHLFHVASKARPVSAMKGHVGSVRALLLCEGRGLVITGSCDATIRCWNLKTDECVMKLHGHTSAVNCLDLHGDRLVSGAKDCLVKVWSLQTGKQVEDLNFKHPRPVQCVKISTRRVYSSCSGGLIKIWDIEEASLLRVMEAHRSSVKCLFLDEWHLLSGDSQGQVMAWSISCDVKQSLITFNHPKEVKSLTLIYLRVITGCTDGNIRIFNFLTGDCLREIKAEAEAGHLLSLHCNDNSIIVNSRSSVKRLQFAKVFWDYAESTETGQGDAGPRDGSVSGESAGSPRRTPLSSAGPNRVVSPSQRVHDCYHKKPEKSELLHRTGRLSTSAKCRTRARERCEVAEQSLKMSEKATKDRMKTRGLHHPPTRDCILLRVGAMQRARCTDEVSRNMEYNATLRDSWGPCTPEDPPQGLDQHPPRLRRAKTCVPILRRAVSQNTTNIQVRDVATAPASGRRKEQQLRGVDTHRTMKRVSSFTATATRGPGSPEFLLMRPPPGPESSTKSGTNFPRIS